MGMKHNEEKEDHVVQLHGSGRVHVEEGVPYLIVTYGEKKQESFYSLVDIFRLFEGRVVSILIKDVELFQKREEGDAHEASHG